MCIRDSFIIGSPTIFSGFSSGNCCSVNETYSLLAVSYTHLDVYKRQGKMLPLEKTFEVAKILSSKHKISFFGGGKNEVETLSNWQKEIPNSENLAGKLSLKQELEKIAELELMISMDSANMHLALSLIHI